MFSHITIGFHWNNSTFANMILPLTAAIKCALSLSSREFYVIIDYCIRILRKIISGNNIWNQSICSVAQ